jgi:hypothetical protein
MNYANNFPSKPRPSGGSTELRPHNLKELAALYSISSKTFKKWLLPFEKEIGKRIGYYYTIPQVRKIFSLLGLPGLFYEEGEAGGQ